ncbi:hypothetical protein [Nocardioides rubriscoriae]|uniref:hypothetical protein n=1 Tax=Nocardioides rubriscoriae TaxID=642762 RepID=UPI001478D892|nr:hypothetical protein [Nocardioides rubriscoriae]
MAVLVLLIHRRHEEESASPESRGGAAPGDLVSALVVELAVTPEAVKHRRREVSPGTPPEPTRVSPAQTAATPTAPAPTRPAPGAQAAPAAEPAAARAPEVWAERRSPYASGTGGAHRIVLPDDDADFDIHWRPQERSLGTAHGAPSPLARTTQVGVTGRIEVGDGDEVVSWRPQDERG